MRLPSVPTLLALYSLSAAPIWANGPRASERADVSGRDRDVVRSAPPNVDAVPELGDANLDVTQRDLSQDLAAVPAPRIDIRLDDTTLRVASAAPLIEIKNPALLAPVDGARAQATGGQTAQATAERIETVLAQPGERGDAGLEIGRILDGMAVDALPAGERAAVLSQTMTLVGDYARNHRLGKAWSPSMDMASAHPIVQNLAAALSANSAMARAEHESALAGVRSRFEGMLRSFHHDINNVLALIQSPLSLVERSLAKNPPSDSRVSKFMRVAMNNVTFLTTIGRIYLGGGFMQVRGPLELESYDGAKYVQLIAGMEEGRAAARNIRLSVTKPDSSIRVLAESDALAVVLKNLVENAIKYTPHGGEVTVGIELHGDLAEFYVRDTGIGVSPEDREKIFQGHRTEKGKAQASGHGVGLSNVRELVEAMGSRIEVGDNAPQGSVFRFSLKVAPPAI